MVSVGSEPQASADAPVSPAVRIGAAVAAASAAAAVSAPVQEDANVARVGAVADVQEGVESPVEGLVGGRGRAPLKSGPSKPLVVSAAGFFVGVGFETGWHLEQGAALCSRMG